MPGVTVPGRVFHAFDSWDLVPAADLLMLRPAIEQSSTSAGPGPACQLLAAVNQEVSRRAALLPASGD